MSRVAERLRTELDSVHGDQPLGDMQFLQFFAQEGDIGCCARVGGESWS